MVLMTRDGFRCRGGQVSGFPLTTCGNDISLSSAFACASSFANATEDRTADKCRQRLNSLAITPDYDPYLRADVRGQDCGSKSGFRCLTSGVNSSYNGVSHLDDNTLDGGVR
jgi:hypothetical protein